MKRKGEFVADKKDMQILYWLDVDGRMSYSQLGKKVGMSKQLVKYRIERLEKERIVKGYYPMIDSSRLGFITFRVYLKFRGLTPDKKDEVVEYLKRQGSVWAVVLMAGKWDVALGISVREIYDFYDVWDKLLREKLNVIADYAISVYSPIYHFACSYLVGKEDDSKVRVLGGRGKADFDEKDLKILSLISKDARVSLLDLANELRLSAEVCAYRLKQLEKKGIIQGYRASIDFGKLGYEFYKAEVRLARYGEIERIIEYCHRHENIFQVDRTIGGETLEVEFHVKSLREMLDVIGNFEKEFPGVIEKFDYLTVLGFEKVTYMPDI